MRARLAAAALLAAIAAVAVTPAGRAADDAAGVPASKDGGCATCHAGIEDMHPWAPVTCAMCHGGDSAAATKDAAHIARQSRPPGDERVLGLGLDLPYARFVDPGDLRVAAQTCGPCHAKAVYDAGHSLHATTSGHLGDGLYENGVVSDRHPRVSIFDVKDELPESTPRPKEALPSLRFPAHWDPKLRIPRGQVVAAASIVSPKY